MNSSDQYKNMINQANQQRDIQYQNNDAEIFEYEINQQLNRKEQFDQAFLTKFIGEIQGLVQQTDEYRFIGNPYRIAVSKFSVDAEGQMLKNLPQDRKEAVYRDISRIFDKEPEGQAFKSKIRKIVNIRLEEIRRQIRENKWNVALQLFQSLLVKAKGNKDVLDLVAYKKIPKDFRQIIWKFCLENDKESDEYAKKMRENRLLTISKFDLQIVKDAEGFVAQMVKLEEFDGSMMFALKTILSYYEKKTDRILSDYLYMLGIPLVYAFGECKYMHKIPVDMVGYFFSLVDIVKFFDPLVDLLIKHDEAYDAEMTDLAMNTIAVIDNQIAEKLDAVLHLENPASRTLLVLIVKRFIHSLGFAFLPLDITIYVWDNIFMKVVKNRLEIFVVFSCMLLCLKESILLAQDWDQMVDIIYIEGQKIDFEFFVEQYKRLFQDSKFYLSQYNVNPELVNRERGVLGEGKNPLQILLDEQSKKDKKLLQKRWNEGQALEDQEDQQDEDGEEDQDSDENQENQMYKDPKYKQMKDLQVDDILKEMKQEQQPYQRLGVVPMQGSEDEDEEDDDEEEDEDEEGFDPLQNF